MKYHRFLIFRRVPYFLWDGSRVIRVRVQVSRVPWTDIGTIVRQLKRRTGGDRTVRRRGGEHTLQAPRRDQQAGETGRRQEDTRSEPPNPYGRASSWLASERMSAAEKLSANLHQTAAPASDDYYERLTTAVGARRRPVASVALNSKFPVASDSATWKGIWENSIHAFAPFERRSKLK